MDARLRSAALIVGSIVAAAVAVALLVEATGKGVALATAVAAIVACIAVTLRVVLLLVRAAGDPNASERLRRFRFGPHVGILVGAPIIVAAAHPWGVASAAVGGTLLLVCHLILVVGSVTLHRRARALRAR
jgi:predicted MFS family arabinose efflux permease